MDIVDLTLLNCILLGVLRLVKDFSAGESVWLFTDHVHNSHEQETHKASLDQFMGINLLCLGNRILKSKLQFPFCNIRFH